MYERVTPTSTSEQKSRPFRMAVVVPTLSSPKSLEALLHSLESQDLLPCEVVVVAQGNVKAAEAMVATSSLSDIRVVHSSPGLALARNRGIAELRSDWDGVALPDDDVIYSPNSLQTAADVLSGGFGAVSGKVLSAEAGVGTRLDFSEQFLVLDSKTVWTSAIEAAYFLSRSFVSAVGSFDELLGLGSSTPWQSGEGTDLLLRGLAQGQRIAFEPSIALTEEPPPTLSSRQRVQRLRKYARGTGRVYRKRADKIRLIGLVIRSAGRVPYGLIREGARSLPGNGAILLGRIEGMIGKTIPWI